MIIRTRKQPTLFNKLISIFIAVTFIVSTILPPNVSAQTLPTILNLPIPGTMLNPTAGFTPVLVKGIKINPEDPLNFTFFVSKGDTNVNETQLREESDRLIKYFLATLTTPSNDLWVNLSPHEKDKMIPDSFGMTEMGRDLLAQDYLLKQLTASLMYPEDELGKKFWAKVKKRAAEEYGIADLPAETYNKVWIVPERAAVYEYNGQAFVVDSHLKVMLAQDYLALQQSIGRTEHGLAQLGDQLDANNKLISSVIRDVLVPEIQKEVNSGETFAKLRQVYHSMILAAWFKNNLKESLLGHVYVNQQKIAGVDVNDPKIKEKIYDQYLKAFNLGVYNYIKEEYDPQLDDYAPRQYFSGGAGFEEIDNAVLSSTYDASNIHRAPLAVQLGARALADELDIYAEVVDLHEASADLAMALQERQETAADDVVVGDVIGNDYADQLEQILTSVAFDGVVANYNRPENLAVLINAGILTVLKHEDKGLETRLTAAITSVAKEETDIAEDELRRQIIIKIGEVIEDYFASTDAAMRAVKRNLAERGFTSQQVNDVDIVLGSPQRLARLSQTYLEEGWSGLSHAIDLYFSFHEDNTDVGLADEDLDLVTAAFAQELKARQSVISADLAMQGVLKVLKANGFDTNERHLVQTVLGSQARMRKLLAAFFEEDGGWRALDGLIDQYFTFHLGNDEGGFTDDHVRKVRMAFHEVLSNNGAISVTYDAAMKSVSIPTKLLGLVGSVFGDTRIIDRLQAAFHAGGLQKLSNEIGQRLSLYTDNDGPFTIEDQQFLKIVEAFWQSIKAEQVLVVNDAYVRLKDTDLSTKKRHLISVILGSSQRVQMLLDAYQEGGLRNLKVTLDTFLALAFDNGDPDDFEDEEVDLVAEVLAKSISDEDSLLLTNTLNLLIGHIEYDAAMAATRLAHSSENFYINTLGGMLTSLAARQRITRNPNIERLRELAVEGEIERASRFELQIKQDPKLTASDEKNGTDLRESKIAQHRLLRGYGFKMGGTGAAVYVSKNDARSAAQTRHFEVDGFKVDANQRPADPDFAAQVLEKVLARLATYEFIQIDRAVGETDADDSRHARVLVPKNYARLAHELSVLYNPAPEGAETATPDILTIDLPDLDLKELGLSDKREPYVLRIPSAGLAIVLGTDYFGEIKKSFLTANGYLAKLEGNIGLHAGSKLIKLEMLDGTEHRVHAVVTGLSGTGKTTTTGRNQFDKLSEEELKALGVRRAEAVLIQDDFVVAVVDPETGKVTKVKGLEAGSFVKLEGLQADQEPEIYNATLNSPDAVLTNVWMNITNEGLRPDFDNYNMSRNSRATLTRRSLLGDEVFAEHPEIDMPGMDSFVLLTRGGMQHGLRVLNPIDAALQWNLGETIETSAGTPDKSKWGQPKRAPGFTAFSVGDFAAEVNRILTIALADQGPQFIIMNTGRVGERRNAEGVRIEEGHDVSVDDSARLLAAAWIDRVTNGQTLSQEPDRFAGFSIITDGVPGIDMVRMHPRYYFTIGTGGL